jgi:hypothetical protein
MHRRSSGALELACIWEGKMELRFLADMRMRTTFWR